MLVRAVLLDKKPEEVPTVSLCSVLLVELFYVIVPHFKGGGDFFPLKLRRVNLL